MCYFPILYYILRILFIQFYKIGLVNLPSILIWTVFHLQWSLLPNKFTLTKLYIFLIFLCLMPFLPCFQVLFWNGTIITFELFFFINVVHFNTVLILDLSLQSPATVLFPGRCAAHLSYSILMHMVTFLKSTKHWWLVTFRHNDHVW